MLNFLAYRLNLLTQANNLFAHMPEGTKEDKLKAIIGSLIENNKHDFTVRNSRFIVFYKETLLEDVHLLQLAKEERQDIPVEGEKKIETEAVIQTPSIYIIFDVKRQIIMLQEKSTVFQDPDVSKNRLEKYLEIKLMQFYITPSISPIVDRNEFWEIVEDADEITEFDITLNSPNLFKGRQRAEDLVEEIHEETNATSFTIKLKNALGKLKIEASTLGDFVSLAAAGAGTFVLKTAKNGVKRILKSFQFIVKKSYGTNENNEIDLDALAEDLQELDKRNEDV